MLTVQEKPTFLFIEEEYEDIFLNIQVNDIYCILLENFKIDIPVIGYEILNDNQTYNDLITDVILPNFQRYFSRKFGEVSEQNFQLYMNKMNEEHREILTQLSEDIVNGFRYHDLFFVENHEDKVCFIYNLPVKKVW
jgi:hypothetical protein